MRSPLVKVTCWVVLLFFPASTLAQPAQGVVQVQGAVSVNGRAVASNSAVFAGDRIQTAADAMATLNAQGMMVQMQSNTTAIFGERTFDLRCGSATVLTSVGTMVRVAGVSVAPASTNSTRIQVSQMNGTVKVLARDNWAVVNDGRIRQILAPGQSVTFSRPGASCQIVFHSVAPAGSRVYLPAAALAGGLFILAYCASNGFCSEASPAGP